MATAHDKEMGFSKETQVPEWEHIAAAGADGSVKEDARAPRQSTRDALSAKFDAILPPHRTYLRLSRKRFLIALTCSLLALLALIIGLAVGLSGSSSRSQNLPLPNNSETHTGELTYFATGLGACGETNKNGDKIVSVSHLLFDASGSTSSNGGNSNANPLCGRMLRAQRYNEAVGAMRSVDLRVVDRCTGCAPTDLDITEDVFKILADVDLGRVEVTWAWL
ncbi:Putative RlpA-like domain superfamily protein [Septoria linicola]|uniref:RlpA-like domain superfamily protein n=1 Tax=Septoria linicola TaxID=215465 RepID=A0A9Q9B5K9_9PEZI|nr:Putative RlpA-like domain superfamily protein [Septoria linicola]